MKTRDAIEADAAAIARIYNEGIEDRVATFETRPREPSDVLGWLGGRHPVVVVEEDGLVVAWAGTVAYSPRECYAGVAEVSIYVARDARAKGAGRLALKAVVERARERGFHKLTGKAFARNDASRKLLASGGFREVGTHRRHGKVGDTWVDVVVVERLLDGA
jgi:L-amino acid N-acyltransferase YncA